MSRSVPSPSARSAPTATLTPSTASRPAPSTWTCGARHAAARDWLGTPRPTRGIGTVYPWPGTETPVRLSTAYDLLIHFPRITAARIR